MTISTKEYYQLVGLLTLAKEYNNKLKDLEKAALLITKEKSEYGGHTMDAIYTDYTVDDLLKKLNIEIS